MDQTIKVSLNNTLTSKRYTLTLKTDSNLYVSVHQFIMHLAKIFNTEPYLLKLQVGILFKDSSDYKDTRFKNLMLSSILNNNDAVPPKEIAVLNLIHINPDELFSNITETINYTNYPKPHESFNRMNQFKVKKIPNDLNVNTLSSTNRNIPDRNIDDIKYNSKSDSYINNKNNDISDRDIDDIQCSSMSLNVDISQSLNSDYLSNLYSKKYNNNFSSQFNKLLNELLPDKDKHITHTKEKEFNNENENSTYSDDISEHMDNNNSHISNSNISYCSASMSSFHLNKTSKHQSSCSNDSPVSSKSYQYVYEISECSSINKMNDTDSDNQIINSTEEHSVNQNISVDFVNSHNLSKEKVNTYTSPTTNISLLENNRDSVPNANNQIYYPQFFNFNTNTKSQNDLKKCIDNENESISFSENLTKKIAKNNKDTNFIKSNKLNNKESHNTNKVGIDSKDIYIEPNTSIKFVMNNKCSNKMNSLDTSNTNSSFLFNKIKILLKSQISAAKNRLFDIESNKLNQNLKQQHLKSELSNLEKMMNKHQHEPLFDEVLLIKNNIIENLSNFGDTTYRDMQALDIIINNSIAKEKAIITKKLCKQKIDSLQDQVHTLKKTQYILTKEVQDKLGNIRVIVRMRPFTALELQGLSSIDSQSNNFEKNIVKRIIDIYQAFYVKNKDTLYNSNTQVMDEDILPKARIRINPIDQSIDVYTQTIGTKKFQFYKVYGPDIFKIDFENKCYSDIESVHNLFLQQSLKQQKEIFNEDIKSLLDIFLMNQTNISLLCYGASTSGKTFTLVGNLSSLKESSLGIVSQTICYLLDNLSCLSSNTDNKQHRLTLSIFEIYVDQIYDLMDYSLNGKDQVCTVANKFKGNQKKCIMRYISKDKDDMPTK